MEGWADDRLGFKAEGAAAEKKDGDFYLGGVVGAAFLPRPDLENRDKNVAPTRNGLEPFYASDYFDALYEYAVELIKKGKAYVCDHTPEEVDRMRGAPDKVGEPSKWRGRS